MVSISRLEMIVKNKSNQTRKSLAINEVSILRQSRQAASLSIKQGSRQIIKWCPRTDSNRGPIDYKSIALPAELQGLE